MIRSRGEWLGGDSARRRVSPATTTCATSKPAGLTRSRQAIRCFALLALRLASPILLARSLVSSLPLCRAAELPATVLFPSRGDVAADPAFLGAAAVRSVDPGPIGSSPRRRKRTEHTRAPTRNATRLPKRAPTGHRCTHDQSNYCAYTCAPDIAVDSLIRTPRDLITHARARGGKGRRARERKIIKRSPRS